LSLAPRRARSRLNGPPNQSAGLSALARTNRTSAVRCFVWCAGRTRCEIDVALSRTRRRCHRTPLMRFSSPTARSNRDALSKAAGPGRSRFGVARPVATRASANLRYDDPLGSGTFSGRTLSGRGVARAVFRFANVHAVVLGVGRFTIRLARFRVNAVAKRRGRDVFDRSCGRASE